MRGKIPTVIKQKVVEEIAKGKISQSEAAKRLGIGKTSIREWLSKYRSEGEIGLECSSQNRIFHTDKATGGRGIPDRQIQPARNLRNIQNSQQEAVARLAKGV